MPEDELSVEITITPRQSAMLAVGVGVGSLVVILLPFLTGNGRLNNPFPGVIGLVYTLYLAHRARRRITRTTLRIDRSGVTTEDGLYDCTWDRAILVWVGASWRSLGQPQLLIYTRAGVSFARRSGTRLHPERNTPLPRRLTGPAFCEWLSRLTDVPVVDGTQTSRRRTERQLLDPVAS